MKKVLFTLLVAALSVMCASADSDENEMSFGVQYSYGTQYKMSGVGIQYTVGLFDHFRLAPEATYYLKKDGYYALDLNLNAEYVIPITEKFRVYPIVGFSYTRKSVEEIEGTYSQNCYGANLGAGIEYLAGGHFAIFAEERAQLVKDYSQSVTNIGVKYYFK